MSLMDLFGRLKSVYLFEDLPAEQLIAQDVKTAQDLADRVRAAINATSCEDPAKVTTMKLTKRLKFAAEWTRTTDKFVFFGNRPSTGRGHCLLQCDWFG